MNYRFRCDCGKLLIDQPLPIPIQIKCSKCAKSFMFHNNDYHEYELGVVVTNENTEKVDGNYKGLGHINKIKRGLIKCRKD
jgi:heterodisulfide reductase subunit B